MKALHFSIESLAVISQKFEIFKIEEFYNGMFEMKKFQVVLILHKNCIQKVAIQSSHLPAIEFFCISAKWHVHRCVYIVFLVKSLNLVNKPCSVRICLGTILTHCKNMHV